MLSGESCIREVAAYLLDHRNFSNVPDTTFVEIVHNALKFVPFTGLEVTSDYYYDVLSTLITPVNNDEGQLSKTKRNDTSRGNDLSISNRSLHKKQVESKSGPKFGSLQGFCENIGAVENYSSDKFSKDEVHKIAILDLRLLNLDRNDQNILVQKVFRKVDRNGVMKKVPVFSLVPIDHGLCIPDNLAVCSFDLCWLGWR